MRRALILAATIAMALGGVLGGLAAAGTFESSSNSHELSAAARTADAIHTTPPEAATAWAIQTMAQATFDAHPTRPPDPDYTPPQNCPSVFPTPYVRPHDTIHQPDPDFKRAAETSEAFAVGSNGIGYQMAVGSFELAPQRWLIVSHPRYPDDCAVLTGHAPAVPERGYEVGPGPVTLTHIDGDTILFATGDGKTGRLNYVTGTLLPP